MSSETEEAEAIVNHGSAKKKSVKDAVSNFLNRPMLDRPASPSLDLSISSQVVTIIKKERDD